MPVGTTDDIIAEVTEFQTASTAAMNTERTYIDQQIAAVIALIPSGSGTGDMLSTNNLSDLTNIIQARANLGLGTAATHDFAELLAATNNLSDLASPATARANLLLGALATLNNINAALISDPTNVKTLEALEIPISDEATGLTVATNVASAFVPYAFTLTKVWIGLGAALSSSGVVTIDAKQNGTTIFSTKPTIGATPARTSLTGTGSVASVLSITSLSEGDLLTFDISAAGTGAKGAKMVLVGHRT